MTEVQKRSLCMTVQTAKQRKPGGFPLHGSTAPHLSGAIPSGAAKALHLPGRTKSLLAHGSTPPGSRPYALGLVLVRQRLLHGGKLHVGDHARERWAVLVLEDPPGDQATQSHAEPRNAGGGGKLPGTPGGERWV